MPVLSRLLVAGRNGRARRDPGTPRSWGLSRKVLTLVRAWPSRRRLASPSPGAVPHPRRTSARPDPALRANPCPEVTDPFCRLPLPTLFYRLEAVHLGDLLRIWVRSGTKITLSPSDFQGPTGALRTPQEPRCFTGTASLSPGWADSREPIPYKEKTTLPGTPVDVSEFG